MVRVLSADVKASQAARVAFLVAVTPFAVLGISSTVLGIAGGAGRVGSWSAGSC
jgi:predicted benzoate:H+ symporter BenE